MYFIHWVLKLLNGCGAIFQTLDGDDWVNERLGATHSFIQKDFISSSRAAPDRPQQEAQELNEDGFSRSECPEPFRKSFLLHFIPPPCLNALFAQPYFTYFNKEPKKKTKPLNVISCLQQQQHQHNSKKKTKNNNKPTNRNQRLRRGKTEICIQM